MDKCFLREDTDGDVDSEVLFLCREKSHMFLLEDVVERVIWN